MRAAPALTIVAARGGAWRALAAALAASSGAALAAWIAAHLDLAPPPEVLAVLAAALAAGCVGWRATRLAALEVGFDGARWSILVVEAGPGHAWQGQLRAVIDLGDWLLLRFEPDVPHASAPRWLPLARRSVGARWHALRCAVYAPQPAGEPGAPAGA